MCGLAHSCMGWLHATGVNAQILRELEAADARALRAIARSPAHLYHESTTKLRQRLKVDSPTSTLRLILQRRCSNVVDLQLKAWFEQRLRSLDEGWTLTGKSQELHLTPEGIPGVACPDCGITFVNRRHMLSHQARKHRPDTDTCNSVNIAKTTKRTGEWYMQQGCHSVGTAARSSPDLRGSRSICGKLVLSCMAIAVPHPNAHSTDHTILSKSAPLS